jgi:hypothetical protein
VHGHCRRQIGGKFEFIYPEVKPRKSIFHLLATIQVFNPGLINSPDLFYIYLWKKFEKFPFYIVENDEKLGQLRSQRKHHSSTSTKYYFKTFLPFQDLFCIKDSQVFLLNLGL